MGRTLATVNQIIQTEEKAFSDFRRTLRQGDQIIFDELFAGAHKHSAAISTASHALPFESILLAMLVEEGVKNRLLRQQIVEMEASLEFLKAELAQIIQSGND